MSAHLIVSTTTDSREQADAIASALIEQRLAACVQIGGPLTSVYRWQGKVETAQEWSCAAKTTAERFEQVAAAIRQLHSYEEPEIIATPIVAGSPGYLQWIEVQVRSAD